MSEIKTMGEVHEGAPKEHLTFKLNQEEYGIDILKVQEIRGYEAPTRLADSPNFIKGLINLRGTIIPIVDLRLKFNCPAAYDSSTVVIILKLSSRIVGVVVDSVSDVMELPNTALKEAPAIDSSIGSGSITGLGALDGRMLILLDIEKLMSAPDMGLLAS